jgi:hypothetical protein
LLLVPSIFILVLVGNKPTQTEKRIRQTKTWQIRGPNKKNKKGHAKVIRKQNLF